MAEKLIGTIQRFVGLSSDTKPTSAPVGSTFYEYDTNNLYITYDDGSNWAAMQTGIKSPESQVSDNFTRPANATPYTAGDVVGTDPGANISFTNVTALSESGFVIMGANLRIDIAAVPSGMGEFRLHLYDSAPTAIADNSAMNLIAADRSKYLGFITMSTPVDLGNTLWSQNDEINFKSKLASASTTLTGVLETRAAFTPSSGDVFTVYLKVVGI